jgi:NTP pyrophosphatase (non-canonical NTP hydrolase)
MFRCRVADPSAGTMAASPLILSLDILKTLTRLSEEDPKTLMQLALKVAEEAGELAQAVLCLEQAPGTEHRGKTMCDVQEEATDVLLCAWAILVRSEISPASLQALVLRKAEKWQTAISQSHRHARGLA